MVGMVGPLKLVKKLQVARRLLAPGHSLPRRLRAESGTPGDEIWHPHSSENYGQKNRLHLNGTHESLTNLATEREEVPAFRHGKGKNIEVKQPILGCTSCKEILLSNRHQQTIDQKDSILEPKTTTILGMDGNGETPNISCNDLESNPTERTILIRGCFRYQDWVFVGNFKLILDSQNYVNSKAATHFFPLMFSYFFLVSRYIVPPTIMDFCEKTHHQKVVSLDIRNNFPLNHDFGRKGAGCFPSCKCDISSQ